MFALVGCLFIVAMTIYGVVKFFAGHVVWDKSKGVGRPDKP